MGIQIAEIASAYRAVENERAPSEWDRPFVKGEKWEFLLNCLEWIDTHPSIHVSFPMRLFPPYCCFCQAGADVRDGMVSKFIFHFPIAELVIHGTNSEIGRLKIISVAAFKAISSRIPGAIIALGNIIETVKLGGAFVASKRRAQTCS